MYVIEILVYSFGFSKKTQREEEIYSRDFYSSFTSPRRFGFLSTTRFPERTRSQRERLRSQHPRNRKKSAIKIWSRRKNLSQCPKIGNEGNFKCVFGGGGMITSETKINV